MHHIDDIISGLKALTTKLDKARQFHAQKAYGQKVAVAQAEKTYNYHMSQADRAQKIQSNLRNLIAD